MVDAQNCLCIYHSNLNIPPHLFTHPTGSCLLSVYLMQRILSKILIQNLLKHMEKLILWNFRELWTKPRSENLKV